MIAGRLFLVVHGDGRAEVSLSTYRKQGKSKLTFDASLIEAVSARGCHDKAGQEADCQNVCRDSTRRPLIVRSADIRSSSRRVKRPSHVELTREKQDIRQVASIHVEVSLSLILLTDNGRGM